MAMDDFLKRVVDGATALLEKIQSPVESIAKAVSSNDLTTIIPYQRRGMMFDIGIITPSGSGGKKKMRDKTRFLPLEMLRRLANQDPITFAIRTARRNQISQTRWSITRDTEELEAEMDQWQNSLKSRLNVWGLSGFSPYEPENIDPKLRGELESQLSGIMDGSYPISEKRAMLRWLFENAIDKIRSQYDMLAQKIKVFKRPCREYTTLNSFLPVIIDDILMFDGGVIVKNKCPDENIPLAELYTRPGHEIFLYRNEDGSVPEPPEYAYLWEKNGQKEAEWTDDELIYLASNPQQDFYGLSPLEVAAYIITTTLYVDNYNMDFFKHSNVPPGVLDLGEGVSPDNRAVFRRAWEAEINRTGGLHRMMFMSGSKGVQYIPLRPYSSKDMQMLEYLKWSLSIKAACFQISPQDIGFTMDLHRTTSEVQYEISKDRGLRTLLSLIEESFNEEIIKGSYKVDNVKFKYLTDTSTDKLREAQIDQIDLANGTISRNIRRKKIGERPTEGGDIIMVESPQGLIPIDLLDDVAEKLMIEIESSTENVGENEGENDNKEGDKKDIGGAGSPSANAGTRPPANAASLPASPKAPTVKVAGTNNDIVKALSIASNRLKKYGKNVEIEIDFSKVINSFDTDIKKQIGYGYDNIRFRPLKDDEDLKGQYEKRYGLHGTALIEAMKGEIIRQSGGNPMVLHSAFEDALSGERHKMRVAIPTLLGAAAVIGGGASVVNVTKELAPKVGGYGKSVIIRTLSKLKRYFKRTKMPAGII